ncbi:IncP-type conjugal transfer protein TraG [Sneathiella sp.]|uniref:IncP-type conjugal transfer protein TraG n=1 Tax=Sneathiella sp. TaxID=1964365 RepID=UPI003564A4CA
MSTTKILIGQFFLVLAIVVGATWAATQWAAQALEYQAALWRPWFIWSDIPVYKPWQIYQWWYAYEAYASGAFNRAGLIALSGGGLGIVAAVIGSVMRSRHERNVTTYGSARWASLDEMNSAGLLSGAGVFLGQWKGRYLRHSGPEHVMSFAPTRSGKGVGLVIPTLLSWTDSAVIHDIKGENWDLTSGWRSQFSTCIRFDPTDAGSPRYNPLMDVRRGPREVRDAQNVADILVDPEGSLEKSDHRQKTSLALLVGTILHVLYAEKDKTLAGCARFLSDPGRSFAATLTAMMYTRHLGQSAHPLVAQTARALLNKSENERSGVLSTALSFPDLYQDPVVASVAGASDWCIDDLVDPEWPVSLYLVCPPSDLSRTKPLMRLLLIQIGRRLTEGNPAPSRRKLLLMLDEFPALGRLDFFEQTLAFVAEYGIRAYLIAQSLNQIEKAYGPNNSILDNCHVRIAFAINDERTAKRVSEALGTATELRSQKNYAGHRLAPWLAHMMASRQETSRPLLMPGEIMRLSAKDELVMVSGAPPVRAQKLRYYRDRNFVDRVLDPAALQISRRPPSNSWGFSRADDTQSVCKPNGKNGDLDGGLETVPELALELEAQGEKKGRDEQPDLDEAQDIADADHLSAVRSAVAMDRADKGMLPDF